MDKNPDATTKANLIDGAEFVRREPALAAVLADMALCAVRRRARRDEPESGRTNGKRDQSASTPAELAARQMAENG